jgi:CubicO group peptidase (beta-lactamase class C family)
VKFRLGSITKQFTSMLVMKQVARGAVRLDGQHRRLPASHYRKDTASKVTIHQLLTHTSGIPSYTDDPKFFPEVSAPTTPWTSS